MLDTLRRLHAHRELLFLLSWKSLATRYRNAYLGILLALIKPAALVLIFMLVRSFVGIDTADIP